MNKNIKFTENDYISFDLINSNISFSKSFLKNINVFLCLLLCIWVAWPYSNYILGSYYTGISLSFLWLLTVDFRWLKNKISWDLLFLLTFFICFIPYIVGGTFREGNFISTLGAYYLFFLGIFIMHYYLYYKKDYRTLGKIAFIFLIMYMIGSLQTYLGLLEHPMASRMLAGAVANNPGLEIIYQSAGIGGFGYIYSACFISIVSLYPLIRRDLKQKLLYKCLSLLSLISMLLMIFQASYAIALLITSIGIFLVLVIKNSKTFFIFGYLVVLAFLLTPKNFISNIFLKIAITFQENKVISQRFEDLAYSLTGEMQGGLTENRLELYRISLDTLLKYPFFGASGPSGNSMVSNIGGHSGWIDLTASYGIFILTPLLLTVFFNFRKILNFYRNTNYYWFIVIGQVIFIGFGFINPIFINHEIGFAIFLFMPALPFLPYAFISMGNNKAAKGGLN